MKSADESVDSEAVRHFIEQTDLDYPRDGQVDAHDIAIFARKNGGTRLPRREQRCEIDGQVLATNGLREQGHAEYRTTGHFCRGHRRGVPARTDPCSKEVTRGPSGTTGLPW